MYPTLLSFGPVTIYSYGVLLAAAYLIGLKLALFRSARQGFDANKVMDLGILIIVSALVGAKLMLFIVDFEYFSQSTERLWSLVRAGGVFYGGLLLAVPVAWWYLRRHRMPVWAACDAFAPGIALGHAIGRLGCLMAGCCYGKPTDMPWGIVFTNTFAAANVGTPLDVHLHPTQLYESFAELGILLVLLGMERRGRGFSGRTFWLYVLLYGVSRFVTEFYRGDPRGMVLDAVSTSQFVSALIVPLSIVMLVYLARFSFPDQRKSHA
jgi:phosphatidylglycerol:prolipoprotein diacylglycerol transferase